MSTTTVSKPGWLLCVGGGSFAIRRAQKSLSSDKGTDAQALRAICEAIWWIACADEMLMEAQGKNYRDARAQSGFDKRMAGLRWVRNRITHQESQWSIIQPPFLWAPSSVIPIPCNPNHDKGRAEYIAHVEGNEAVPFLNGLLKDLKASAIKFPWTRPPGAA